MQLSRFRPLFSTFVVVATGFFILAFGASPSVAWPQVVATSVVGGCNGTAGYVTITLHPQTYGAFGSGLYAHFDGGAGQAWPGGNPATYSPIASGVAHTLIITTSPGPGGTASATYHVTVPPCSNQTDSLSVIKTVINNTIVNTSLTTFPVDVSCNHGTISTTLNLSMGTGYQQTVSHIPVGSTCQIQEQAIPPPQSGCHWVTTYPHGQAITLSSYADYIIPVQNELVCETHCPPGTTEQIWPGTHIKFCCKGKLDPKSDEFCCTREHSDIREEKMSPVDKP
jgi:hypothetical protein